MSWVARLANAITRRYGYIRDVWSPQLNNSRDLVVYVPPSYAENPHKVRITRTDRLPTIQLPRRALPRGAQVFDAASVLWMHDGQNLFNASTRWGNRAGGSCSVRVRPLVPHSRTARSAFGVAWMCQDAVDGTVVAGASREVILVGVDNTADRTWEYTYSYDPTVGDGGGADAYLDFLAETVVPLVQATYRVRGDGPWQLLGSSLGGLVSCYAAYTRPQSWSAAGCMSSSFWWNGEDFRTAVIPSAHPTTVSLYLDSGDAGPDDDDVNQTLAVLHTLQAGGWVVQPTNAAPRALGYYLDHGGQHSEAYWGARFHVPVQWAFPPAVQTAAVSAPESA